MRILSFAGNVQTELKRHYLKDCNVVIDGQNYFYNTYERSGLPFVFGCEADKYAEFLREHLSMFKESNVRCYIIFKGGHEDQNAAIDKKQQDMGKSFSLDEPTDEPKHVVLPVFMKTVYKEVLEELRIDYAVCQFEAKQQCIALAQKLKCPIISQDIEFCFSGVPYIPESTLKYDPSSRGIKCGLFEYEKFSKKYNLSKESIAIFIALTDLKIHTFPEGIFNNFFTALRLTCQKPFMRNIQLLKWLSQRRSGDALRIVKLYLSTDDERQFREEITRIMNFICRIETLGTPARYLLDKNVPFENNDPNWFEKGVVMGDIAINYVNLYFANIYFGSWCIEDVDDDDAMLLSFDIIAYAFNLLTNYKRDEIVFYNNNGEEQRIDVSLGSASKVRKPSSLSGMCPFKRGWDHVKSLHLFDHFLTEKIIDVTALSKVRDEEKLLLIALVYFSRQKIENTRREVYCILLSYVMLGVVSNEMLKKSDSRLHEDLAWDSLPEENEVTKLDCVNANSKLGQYFSGSCDHLRSIFDRKLIHSFVQFQHCLQQLNNLNKLCGKPYKPTLISKTYNGTFVYELFYTMKELSTDDVGSYIEKKICSAPTVLAYLEGLVNVYDELL